LGVAWYGSKISDTIPATAVVQKFEFYVSAVQIQGNNPIFATHTELSRPAGAPTLTSVGAFPISGGWVDLEDVGLTIGNALKTGGGSFGVGLDHGGFNVLHSLAEDGQSAALRITSQY
jgi:hypothetical protein